MAITWREIGILSDAAGLDDYEEEEDRTDDEDAWECEFPDRCLMPGDHMRSECYTREMAEEWADEAARNS